MKKKFTFLIAAFMLLTMINLPGKAVGQTTLTTGDLDFGTPQVSENFNSLSTTSTTATSNQATTLTSGYGEFNYVYVGKSNKSSITNDATFDSRIMQLEALSSSPIFACITGKTFGTTGAFSVKIKNDGKTYFGLYKNTDTNYGKANASVFLYNNSGTLQMGTGNGWGSDINSSAYTGDIIEVCVIYNNTNSAASYGDNISLASKTAHIYVNGTCIMDGNNPKAVTIPGNDLGVFRVNSTAKDDVIKIDDLKIYNTLPTAASSTYTVSFDCDGGTVNCPEDIEDLEEGDDFTIPSTAPTKDCYTFEGWYDDELNEYELGETYQCPASDLTITAVWTLNTYTISYSPGEGTGNAYSDEDLNCGSDYTFWSITDLAYTAPAGKPTFVNWKDQDNATYAAGDEIQVSKDLTLTAQWTGATLYAVTFNCNGDNVEGCPANMNVEAGTQITLPDAPTREGYTFNCGGWWNTSDNSRYAPGSPYFVNAAVTFRADWIENQSAPAFTVTGVSNGTTDTYYATASVSINTVSGYTYFYTTNGDDPTTSSTEYTSAIVVNTTGSTTIKAIATQYGCTVSPVGTKTITIVQPNEATFTNGVYASLNTEANYNTWYKYNVSGDQVWSWASYSQTYYAKMSGYASNTNNANEDWLISPKMTVTNGKLAVSFDCAAKFGTNKLCSAQYSTDYPGYGDPSGYTWTKLIDLPTANNYTFAEQNMTITGVTSDVYVAIKYVSNTDEASTIEINNFTAKQCYPVTYVANGGSGTMTDPNSPYAVGTEVTVLANTFTAPEDKAFSCWNDGEDDIFPSNKFNMGTAAVTLTAQWVDICHTPATMAATIGASEYVNNSGTKSYKINLSSSVTALSDCVSGGAITSYGFVYSTENETPTVDNGTVIEKGNSYTTANVEFTDEIANATLDATYYIRSYATNTAGTAYGAKATVVIPAAYPSYTISYETNGVAEATTTTIFQGDAITNLLAAPAQAVPSGYTFMGWYGGDYDLNNTAPTFVKNGDAISGNITLKAVFAIASANNSTTGELTQSEITSNITSSACAYGTEKTYEDTGDGINWIASCFADQGRLWMQIKKDASDSYIKIVAPDVITNVEVLMTSTSNSSGGIADITKHTAFSGTVYLATSAGTSSTGNVGSMSSSNFDGNYANINPTGNNSTLYIQVTGGAARIWGISVTYGGVEYFDYCTSVSPQTAISGTITEGHLTTNGTIAAGTAVYLTEPLTINSNVTLTVNGAIGNATAANLIIEDGGQLILPNNAAVAATVQKTTEASTAKSTNKWYAIASPVNDVAISSFVQGTHNVYRYDEENIEWEEYRNNDNKFSTLENGRGYLYRSTTANLAFAGDVNAGDENGKVNYDLSFAYAGSKTDFKGINLLGNPFTHNITWSNLETTNVETAGYYLLIEEGENQGKWSATASTTATIAPMQAFLVQANDTGAKVTIKNSTAKGGEEKSYNDNIMFTVMNGQQSDETYVFFKEGHGLNKIDHRNAEIPMLYVVNNGERFAIAEMPDNIKSINLGFNAKTFGKYTLSLKANGNFSYLHLIDRLTGEDVDMLLENEYSFIASPTDNANRFIVRLEYSENAENSETFAFQNGSDIIVNGEGELQIFDVMGRMIATQRINGVETVNVSMTGVYIFKLNEKTQKIVVR